MLPELIRLSRMHTAAVSSCAYIVLRPSRSSFGENGFPFLFCWCHFCIELNRKYCLTSPPPPGGVLILATSDAVNTPVDWLQNLPAVAAEYVDGCSFFLLLLCPKRWGFSGGEGGCTSVWSVNRRTKKKVHLLFIEETCGQRVPVTRWDCRDLFQNARVSAAGGGRKGWVCFVSFCLSTVNICWCHHLSNSSF